MARRALSRSRRKEARTISTSRQLVRVDRKQRRRPGATRLSTNSSCDTKYEGRTNIPPHTNFIVAANHSSHLDMGLAKMALGDAGKDLVALAAADYFFDTKYKRAYMENFTNLVPMERTGSLRQSLRHARDYLDRGYNALIFPEGTRSMTGQMADFKPVIGYLALQSRVGILPVYLYGTYEAFPKGSAVIKSRDVGARIGRFLSIEELEEMTARHGSRRGLSIDRRPGQARNREPARPDERPFDAESCSRTMERPNAASQSRGAVKWQFEEVAG